MIKNGNHDNLKEFRKDFSKIPKLLKEYSLKAKKDLVEYHGHSWKHFGKNLAATGLPRVFLLTFLYSGLETVVPKLFHNSSEFLKFFPEMSNYSSIVLRSTLVAPLIVGGYLEDKFRIKSRKRGKGSFAHKDGKLGTKLNFMSNFPGYFWRFGASFKDSGLMTLATAPLSYFSSRVEGFLTDLSKYAFLGYKPSERIPEWMKKIPRGVNIGIATSTAVLFAAGTYGNYKLADKISLDKNDTKKEIKMNFLEKKTLLEAYPEFKNFSIKDYTTLPDGLKVDTFHNLKKNKYFEDF